MVGGPIDRRALVEEDGRVPTARQAHALLAVGLLAGVAFAAMAASVAADTASPYVVWALPFAVGFAGGIVAFRARGENLAARRLLAFGAVGLVWIAGNLALHLAYDAHGEGGWLVAPNLVHQMVGLLLLAAIVALLAVYPDGVYQRRSDTRLVQGLVAASVLLPLLLLLASAEIHPAWVLDWAAEEGTLPPLDQVESPLYVGALAWLAPPLAAFMEAALAVVPLIGCLVAVRRYRRFGPERRLQMKWPMAGAIPLALAPLIDAAVAAGAIPFPLGDADEIVAIVVFPCAITIGLVRPQLFDIEGVVRRAAAYGLLLIVVAGVYVGIAAALGVALGGENLQVAAAMAIVATLVFEPARRALTRRAARFAGGERVSGEELMRRLGATLEHTLDRGALMRAIAATAREGIGARWARIRLDDGGEVLDGAQPRPDELPALSAPIVHAGERVGEIECGASAHGRLYGSEQELLDTLARQAGLAIANARLAEELGTRLRELRASRARIVQAEERARRRIERDIHDGSQQDIAALIARIGLARNQLRRDSALASETLADVQSEAQQALDNLRQLASGIHPSVLTDRGIVEAIEARAARLPLGVTIECDPDLRLTRFDEAVEGGVWFLVSECFANTLKHSRAERAWSCASRAWRASWA